MKTVSTLKNKSLIFIGLLTVGVLKSSIPVLASDSTIITDPNPFIPATGSAEDLQGVESRDIARDFGGIGGAQDLQLSPETTTDYKPEISAYEAQTRSINLRLEPTDERMGDTSRITRRLPFLHF